jgi:hypothetical protein
MNASYATVILFEMAHRWAQVQNLPGDQVATSSEKEIFDRMAKEFPAMAMAAKLLQAAGFDYVNGLLGFDALPGDLQLNADHLARLICRAAPAIVREGERRAAEAVEPGNDSSVLLCEDGPVAITLERGDSVEIVGRTRTIADAESYLSLSASIDPDDLQAGHYGIDAPFGLGADSEAEPAAKRLGFHVFARFGGIYWAKSGQGTDTSKPGYDSVEEAALRALASLSPDSFP